MSEISLIEKMIREGKASKRERDRLLHSHDVSFLPSFIAKRINSVPDVVVQPETIEDVVEIVKYASEKKVPVVPRGAATSGYGGPVPVSGGIVVDFTRMDKILEIGNDFARVQPGVKWYVLERELNKQGKSLRMYPSSAYAATVAGFVAQGGYGIGSFKYGSIERNVESVKIVDARGEVKELPPESVVGACGTTGLIVEAKVRVREQRKPVLRAFHVKDAGELVGFLRSLGGDIFHLSVTNSIFENFKREAIEKMPVAEVYTRHGKLYEKLPSLPERGFIVLVALESGNLVFEGGEELDEGVAEYLWEERFYSMRLRRLGPGLAVFEGIVDTRFLGNVLEKVSGWAIETVLVDGGRNALILAMQPVSETSRDYLARYIDSIQLLKVIKEFGGKPYSTGIFFSELAEEVLGKERLMRLFETKREIDPSGIFNPGKVFPKKLVGRNPGNEISDLIKLALNVGSLAKLGTLIIGGSKLVSTSLPEEVTRIALECTQCGYCEYACPVFSEVKWAWSSPRGKFDIIKQVSLGRYTLSEEDYALFYLCSLCKECEIYCQGALPILDTWLKTRQLLTSKGYVPTSIKKRLEIVAKTGNSLGVEPLKRWEWLPAKYKEKKRGDVALWVGCWESTHMTSIPLNMISILEKAGVDFQVLGEDERCCGIYAWMSGDEKALEEAVTYHMEVFRKRGVKQIVAHCPGCYLMLSKIYPQQAKKLGFKWEVEVTPFVELLSSLIKSGKIKPEKELSAAAAYHDSCHLGRWEGIYVAPREILNSIPGLKLIEPEHSYEESRCCAAFLALVDQRTAFQIALKRIKEIKGLGVQMLVTACPACLYMLSAASDYSRAGLPVIDYTELVKKSIE
ncbi:MAG: FAD-binding oxidoreductase [Thermofilum sp.]|nr:FAD-binding oxidoreductase [Thermofilum sp.]